MAPSSTASAPYVELHADLPDRVAQVGQKLGTPTQQLEAALSSYRLLVINYAKREMANILEPNASDLIRVVDTGSQLYLKQFSKLVGPVALQGYTKAYRSAKAGKVPPEVLYALAEEHADRMGRYFNETSREALVAGFNTYVNRRMPARQAVDRVLDAFGLTLRQMNAYTSIEDAGKISSPNNLNLRARALEYIGRSFRSRLKIFAKQELHNLDNQAKQTAFLWMQSQGTLSDTATKLWITAKDERTCPVCAPMNGKSVPVQDKFTLPNGIEVWVPGVHPNCRCEIRVRDLSLLQKDLLGGELKEFNEEHPRDPRGRFSAKQRAADALRERAKQSPGRFVPVGFADPIPSSVERMAREAEEYRRQREQKAVIDQTPVIDLSNAPDTSTIDLGNASVDLRSKKIDLGHRKIDLSRPRASVNLGSRQKLQLGSAQKLDLTNKIEQIVLKDQVLNKPTRRRKFLYRPTKKIVNLKGDHMKVYAVFDPFQLDQDGKFESDDHIIWTDDYRQVASQASDAFEEKMQEAYEHIGYSENFRIEETTRDGQRLYAQVDPETVSDLIHSIAFDQGHDPEWHGERVEVPVRWENEDGKFMHSENLTYKDLAEKWQLTPDLFEVLVISINEGHESSLGHTERLRGGGSPGEDWITTGTYIARAGTQGFAAYDVPVLMMDAEPDVETEEFGDHDE